MLANSSVSPDLIIVPDGTVDVKGRMYRESSARGVVLPDSARTVGAQVFACMGELEKAVLNDGLKVIEPYAFAMCYSLKELTLPKSLKEIGECAFSDCSALEKINIPKNCTLQGKVFMHCRSLKEVTVAYPIKIAKGRLLKQTVSPKIDPDSMEERVEASHIKGFKTEEEFVIKNEKELAAHYRVFGNSPFAEYLKKLL